MPGSALKTTQRQAAATRGQALATVGHELRTPLSGIVGMAELLSGTALTPEQRSYVEAIRGSGAALASLLDEMLDHARIETGRLDIVEAPLDLGLLIERVVELLAPRAQGNGIEIAASIARDIPARIIGDAARLRQILLNVVGNAVKFTETGGVGVEAWNAGRRLKIAVIDTGPGVPAARQAAIFDAFEQAGPATARQFGGAGLGLAISRQLATRMGGSLQLTASSPKGSTFVLDLPLRRTGQPHLATSQPSRLRRALIVANSPFEAPYMAARLREIGIDVHVVADTSLARARLSEKFDLMIVDGAQGEARARSLAQAARAAGIGRRLVLFSPFERRAFGPPAMRAFDGWLIKPVRARSLFARIEGFAPAGAAVPARFEVLLAEDNEISALLATRYLERFGARVTRAVDGAAAVALVQSALQGARPRFDAAVLDVRMPKLDGVEAARRIRAAEVADGAPGLRLIALSADRLDREAAKIFDEILPKPIELTRIGRALEACRRLPD